MPKTVLPSKFQEWKGLDRINQVVHEMNCIFRELSKDDFGVDGEIEIVTPKADGKGYQTTGGIVKVQAKAGKSYVVSDSKDEFSMPAQKADLQYWYNATFPILLIVYHPKDDKLYWKEVKSYVKSTPGVFKSPLRVRFNKKTDEFTTKSYERICEAARVSPPRVSRQQRERLYSNLLLIKRLLKTISYAPTRFQNFQDIRNKMEGTGSPFTVIDGVLYTLDDLRNDKCPMRRYCDTKKVDDISSEAWSQDEIRRRDFVFLLNQLFGSHLYHCGLKYNKHFKREYFPRQDEIGLEFRLSWYNVRTGRAAPARIVVKYYEYGRDRFWRHTAASLSFRNIANSWFLQIVPKYFFTTDGEAPCPAELVGPYTTRLKASEYNYAVLNHVLFWADVLSQRNPVIKVKLHHGKILMEIEKEPLSGISGFAIPKDPAIYEEDDANQRGLFPDIISLANDEWEEVETDNDGLEENDEY